MNHKMTKRDKITAYALIGVCVLMMGAAITIGALRQNSGGAISDNLPEDTSPRGQLSLADLVGKGAETPEPPAPSQAELDAENPPAEAADPVVTEPAAIEPTAAKSVSLVLRAPTESGEITMDYSLNREPVYSKTFNEYRSDHAGTDYAAKLGENVYAAADGRIAKIYTDERLGMSVLIEHTDGFFTQYSNLSESVGVKVGDQIEAGDKIGSVGKTAAVEQADDPHVHFAVQKDGQYVDCREYME